MAVKVCYVEFVCTQNETRYYVVVGAEAANVRGTNFGLAIKSKNGNVSIDNSHIYIDTK